VSHNITIRDDILNTLVYITTRGKENIMEKLNNLLTNFIKAVMSFSYTFIDWIRRLKKSTTKKKNNFFTKFTTTVMSFSYTFIDRNKRLNYLLRRGGIRFKWALVISMILLLMVIMFISLFTVMSSRALVSANDTLCKAIAGNISATESILTAETRPTMRSLILQDIVNGLEKSKINGLQSIAVYDLTGMLVGKKGCYAANIDGSKRGKKIPAALFDEIKDIENFQKTKKNYLDKDNKHVSSFQYRLPLNFFSTKVGIVELLFSEASILEPVQKSRRIIFLFSCGLLIMGIGITVVVAKGMVQPIMNLFEGMVRVREGDLEIRMDIRRHDELGNLSHEFNNMIIHLREKLQMQKFVSERTVSMIHEQTSLGEIVVGGIRQNLAFLFSDIRGFTAMSEKMEPEDVVTILNEYLNLQANIIKKHNGDIDKYVGDEVMAVFSGDEKADNAIACSIEIIKQIESLNISKGETGMQHMNVGIGLNLGNVIQGRMGSSDRMDNTCIGDAVNLAARLCSRAESGAILASKAIVSKMTSKKFLGKKLDPIKVKGKEQPVEVYSITGVKVSK
jgi:class 3 adenylate cyclase